MKRLDGVQTRALLLRALPDVSSLCCLMPTPKNMFPLPACLNAARPESVIVEGESGTGKSFLWAAMQNPIMREWMASVDKFTRMDCAEVVAGFGKWGEIKGCIEKWELQVLRSAGWSPYIIWKTVVNCCLFPPTHPWQRNWKELVEEVASRPGGFTSRLSEKDMELRRRGRWVIILFDSPDKMSTREEQEFVQGLIHVAGELLQTDRIRAKCFVRPEQMKGVLRVGPRLVTAVLTWRRESLCALLWKYLANAEGAEFFRFFAELKLDIEWNKITLSNGLPVYEWPRVSLYEEKAHTRLFEEIAGGEMSPGDKKRGTPYNWLFSHLADAHGTVGPRVFLSALRAAAEDTQKNYPEHEYAIHYQSIVRAVHTQSIIRPQELSANHLWIDRLMRPLEGLFVPCEFEEICERWHQAGVTLENLWAGGLQIPPHRGYEGVREYLEDLGVFHRMVDGQVMIPPIFAAAYRMGRRGGVKPNKKDNTA